MDAPWGLLATGTQHSSPRQHKGAEPVSLNSLFSQFHQGSKRGCQSVRAVFTTHPTHIESIYSTGLHQQPCRLHSCSSSPWTPGSVLVLLWGDSGGVNNICAPATDSSVSRAVSWDPVWCQCSKDGWHTAVFVGFHPSLR